jgi:signal transduction histidine kinase
VVDGAHDDVLRRWWARTGPPVATAAALVVVLVVLDGLLPAAREPNRALRVLLEGLQAAVGALTALLMYGRARSTMRRADAALVASLALAATVNLGVAVGFAVLPPSGSDHAVDAALDWGALGLRVVAVLYLVVAALGSRRRLRPTLGPGVAVLVAVAGPVLVAVAVLAPAREGLPTAVSLAVDGDGLHLAAHPLVGIAQGGLVVLSTVGAVGFLIRGTRLDDRFLLWIGMAITLGTVARVAFWVRPSLYSDVVRVGDGLRFADHLVLLAAAVVEIRSYWAAEAVVLAQHERQRLARTLHDGVLQELTFLRAWAASVTAGRDRSELVGDVVAAVDRAHVESRQLLDLLASPPLALGSPTPGTDPLTSLRVEVETLAARAGVEAEVRWPAGDRRGGGEAAVLGAIAREAVVNALRHGRPGSVTVALWPGGDCLLRVVDDGGGSDGAVPGFGRRAMADLAAELGADVTTGPGPDGAGTAVEVWRR